MLYQNNRFIEQWYTRASQSACIPFLSDRKVYNPRNDSVFVSFCIVGGHFEMICRRKAKQRLLRPISISK